MIWSRGEILPDDALAIPVLDRTFEHGLGLFETFRTWDRRPSLLGRHLDRLRGSAQSLGLVLDESSLPRPIDVQRLLDADGREGDAVLRLTLSGGRSAEAPGTLWMRSRPLAPATATGLVVRSCWRVFRDDPLSRHKSLNYWHRRLVFEAAQADGFDEDLARDEHGVLLEGTRSNLFVVDSGQLRTPSLWLDDRRAAPLLPGVMRAVVLERADAIGIEAIESPDLTLKHLGTADEVFLSNGGRGIMPVSRFESFESGAARSYPAPGPTTRRLIDDLDAWLPSENAS